MNSGELLCLHATVEGDVQGVGFRYFVQEIAVGLGLTGWVRNRFTGTVEVMAEGQRLSLEKLLGDLRRGPHSSYVGGVNFEWLPASGEFAQFSVRMTA